MKEIPCVDEYGNEYLFREEKYVPRTSVYGVSIKDNHVLLVQNKSGERWGLPGGGVDEGETSMDGLQREFQEETGLRINDDTTTLLTDITYFLADGKDQPPWKSFRTVFLVHVIDGDIYTHGNGGDTLQVKYIPIHEAARLLMKSATDKPIAKVLKKI